MDETYIRVKGQWPYLYRAVDKTGQTIDFLLTELRREQAARRILTKAIRRHSVPETITIDGGEANAAAIRSSNAEHDTAIVIRQVKYLNNILEQDHRTVKWVTRPMLGFKSLEAAQYTLAGAEPMHSRKGNELLRREQRGSLRPHSSLPWPHHPLADTGNSPQFVYSRKFPTNPFLAQATPEDKLRLIREEQAKGKLLAMCGDGTNDAPALVQADVGVAMNPGTSAAKEAGNMVDLDSNPTKLLEIVEIGKQLLITRGSLTTFSIANDVAKYFAIIPAMFVATYPELAALNVMRLATPQSAILSAVIFNALIIIALIPLALRGVAYRPLGAAAILRRNLLIYGVGGVMVPFIGIKAIDLLLVGLRIA